MDITKEKREEEGMSGKLKISEKKGGDRTDIENSEKSKRKKRSEPSLDKLNPKYMKITLPLSQSDDHIFSKLSILSQDDFKIAERKKTKIIPEPLVTAPEVTQDQDDMEKDDKVSSIIEGSKQRSVCVTPLLSLKTPPKYINKRDYKGDTHDKTLDSRTKDTDV